MDSSTWAIIYCLPGVHTSKKLDWRQRSWELNQAPQYEHGNSKRFTCYTKFCSKLIWFELTWGWAWWCIQQILALWCWHPIRALLWTLAAPFPNQLPVGGLGKQPEDAWDPAPMWDNQKLLTPSFTSTQFWPRRSFGEWPRRWKTSKSFLLSLFVILTFKPIK